MGTVARSLDHHELAVSHQLGQLAGRLLVVGLGLGAVAGHHRHLDVGWVVGGGGPQGGQLGHQGLAFGPAVVAGAGRQPLPDPVTQDAPHELLGGLGRIALAQGVAPGRARRPLGSPRHGRLERSHRHHQVRSARGGHHGQHPTQAVAHHRAGLAVHLVEQVVDVVVEGAGQARAAAVAAAVVADHVQIAEPAGHLGERGSPVHRAVHQHHPGDRGHCTRINRSVSVARPWRSGEPDSTATSSPVRTSPRVWATSTARATMSSMGACSTA